MAVHRRERESDDRLRDDGAVENPLAEVDRGPFDGVGLRDRLAEVRHGAETLAPESPR
jgi:hypothetical protein